MSSVKKLSIALMIAFAVVLAVSFRDFVFMLTTISDNFVIVVSSVALSVFLALYYKKQL